MQASGCLNHLNGLAAEIFNGGDERLELLTPACKAGALTELHP